MFEALRRWRPIHLLGAWCAYWIVLIVVGSWPALVAHLRIVPRPGATETISVNYGDGILSATTTYGGTTLWSGSVHILTFALCVAVPPLALWFVWLTARRRGSSAATTART